MKRVRFVKDNDGVEPAIAKRSTVTKNEQEVKKIMKALKGKAVAKSTVSIFFGDHAKEKITKNTFEPSKGNTLYKWVF